MNLFSVICYVRILHENKKPILSTNKGFTTVKRKSFLTKEISKTEDYGVKGIYVCLVYNIKLYYIYIIILNISFIKREVIFYKYIKINVY